MYSYFWCTSRGSSSSSGSSSFFFARAMRAVLRALAPSLGIVAGFGLTLSSSSSSSSIVGAVGVVGVVVVVVVGVVGAKGVVVAVQLKW